MLVGRRILDHRRGVDAGLGGEGRGADIGRVAVGRAVEDLVEHARHAGQGRQLLGGDADLEALGIVRLEQQRRDQRDQIGVAAALAEAVQRALDLAHAGAHRGQRVGDGLLGVVVGVDAEPIARDRRPRPRRRCARPRAAACRHWCRRARSSARRPHGPPGRRPAHSRDWPCSRRRNARSRAAPRGPRARAVATLSRIAVEILVERDAERQPDLVVPALGDEADRIGLGVEQGGDAGIVGGRAAGPLGHAEGGEAAPRRPRSSAKNACRAGWRRDSRPRHSRRRDRRACGRPPACRAARSRRRSSARRRAASCRRDRGGRGS